ncbi:MAG: fumarylacetoacetate hydrolase family protein [Geminicoccaceae bacterium]
MSSRARKAIIVAMLFSFCSAAGAERSDNLPRVLRYLPDDPNYAGQTCHALVLEAPNGIPSSVANLGLIEPELCQAVDRDVAPETTRLALITAERLLAEEVSIPPADVLPQDELGERIQPPVEFTSAAIDESRRLIIVAGLNYAEHRDEVGAVNSASAADLLLIPKATPPTSAYRPVPTGVVIGSEPPRPVLLLDYEVEIALVLLDGIDLRAPPTRSELLSNTALVAANDVSDRGPIIQDDTHGYTRGKSQPGYFPLGPWLVPAWHLDVAAGGEGGQSLAVELTVSKRTSNGSQLSTTRQSDHSTSMLHGPEHMIAELSRRYLAGGQLCMPDAWGRPRLLHDGEGRIPAGSILLTGTPGGTAVRPPNLFDKARLFFEGGLSVSGARAELIEEQERDAQLLGYLRPGDVVETWVEKLGRQLWSVIPPDDEGAGDVYGITGSGSCDDFERGEG